MATGSSGPRIAGIYNWLSAQDASRPIHPQFHAGETPRTYSVESRPRSASQFMTSDDCLSLKGSHPQKPMTPACGTLPGPILKGGGHSQTLMMPACRLLSRPILKAEVWRAMIGSSSDATMDPDLGPTERRRLPAESRAAPSQDRNSVCCGA
jgi:hypothetical protein